MDNNTVGILIFIVSILLLSTITVSEITPLADEKTVMNKFKFFG